MGIAHVPEGRGTFVDLTVEENLRIGMYARRDKRHAGRDMDRVLELFPILGQRRKQNAGTLSGGEQQMLAVARALMLGPRLLLLDEPSLGLAPLVVREIFRILRAINQESRVSILLVEQNASIALDLADHVFLLETGRVVLAGTSDVLRARRRHPPLLPRLLKGGMDIFIQQVMSGLATGGIYASLALALVMIYQATDVVNFAQGEMAMFAPTSRGPCSMRAAVLGGFLLTLAIAFVGRRGHPARGHPTRGEQAHPHHRHRTLGLLVILNSVAGWIWTYCRSLSRARFPASPSGSATSCSARTRSGEIAVTLVMLALLFVFFRFTPLGLAMRAAAQNPESSRLAGIRVSWMLALGWGLAATFGAVAGMMVAPIVFLDPNMMGGIQIYAFAAATVGGFTSPAGAVLGGFMVGIVENLVGTYVSFIGTELKLTVALAMIIVVLLVKPSGLFGRAHVRRV